jgi:Aminoacyl-tRNA editing domain
VATSEHVPAKELAKTVIVIADDGSVMVVVPASHEVQISQLARALGAHAARLAEDPEFGPMFSDCELGAMPPFGNLYGLDVYAAEDESIVNVDPTEPRGAFIEMGVGTSVVAFMAPGLVVMADIRSVAEVQVGSSIQLGSLTGVITLDGERSLVAREQTVHFALEADGPWVVETAAALRWAQRLGAFQMGDAERAHVGLFASLAGRHGVRAQG